MADIANEGLAPFNQRTGLVGQTRTRIVAANNTTPIQVFTGPGAVLSYVLWNDAASKRYIA